VRAVEKKRRASRGMGETEGKAREQGDEGTENRQDPEGETRARG
jgi:hypothetical protein